MRRTLATLLLVSSLTACQHQAIQPIIPPVSATLTAQKLLNISQLRTPLLYLEAPIYDSEVQEWIPKRFLEKVQNSIQETVNNPYIDAQLQLSLAQHLSTDDMQAVIDFYQSPTGQAVLTAETDFRKTINQPENSTQPETMNQLREATQLSSTLNSVFLASANALIERLDSYDCLALMQIPGSNIGLNIAKRNKVAFMNQQVQRSLANLYSPLTPEQLQAYLQFATSPTGQHFFTARTKALTALGNDFGLRLAENIAPGLPSCVGSIRVSPAP
jgi:hypothetical protein